MRQFATVFLLAALVGCQPTSTGTNATTGGDSMAEKDAHAGHNHDHDETGPRGGHILHFEPTGVHAEWTHDDETGLITVYMDDFSTDKIEMAKFMVEIPESDPEEFSLEAGEDGWTVTSEALMTHMNMGETVEVKLVIVDDSGEQSAKIENHADAHDHGHAH